MVTELKVSLVALTSEKGGTIVVNVKGSDWFFPWLSLNTMLYVVSAVKPLRGNVLSSVLTIFFGVIGCQLLSGVDVVYTS